MHPKAHFRHQHWQIGLRANNVAAEILPEDAPVPLCPVMTKFCPKTIAEVFYHVNYVNVNYSVKNSTVDALCGNNRIEYKINSGHLKPKTEFRFN